MDTLAALTDLALIVTLWSTGIAIGMLDWPARESRVVDRRFLALILLNVVGVPAAVATWVVLTGTGSDQAAGLILVAAAGGGALGLKTTQLARGQVRLAVALILVLEVLNFVSLPVWTAVVLREQAPPPIAEIGRTVLLLVLVPLLVGAAIRRVRPSWSKSLGRAADQVATAGLLLVLILIVGRNGSVVADSLGTGLPVAALLLVVGGLAAGGAVAGAQAGARRAAALVTAGRANALALVVAQGAFGDRPGVSAATVVVGVVSLVVPVVIAVAWASASGRRGHDVPSGVGEG